MNNTNSSSLHLISNKEISSHDLYLSLFCLNDYGPDVLLTDIMYCIDHSVHLSLLKRIATFSMVAISQGNEYHEGVHLLPVSNETDMVLLIVSFLIDSENDPIHENYYQLAIIMNKRNFVKLPNVISIEQKLLTLCRIIFNSKVDLTPDSLHEFKMNLLHLLNSEVQLMLKDR